MAEPKKPFYGLAGNLLVEDLQENHARVQDWLNGTFRPQFWAQQFWPGYLMRKYPQLRTEYEMRLRARRGWRAWPPVRLRGFVKLTPTERLAFM